MKECDNSTRKIHISSNFILPINFLITFDTLLLRPSLRCNTLLHFTQIHFTTLRYPLPHSPNYTSLHFVTLLPHFTQLHFTTLRYTSPHFIQLHFTTLRYTSPHFTQLHFTTLRYTSPQIVFMFIEFQLRIARIHNLAYWIFPWQLSLKWLLVIYVMGTAVFI
jgi:hypothetical protein